MQFKFVGMLQYNVNDTFATLCTYIRQHVFISIIPLLLSLDTSIDTIQDAHLTAFECDRAVGMLEFSASINHIATHFQINGSIIRRLRTSYAQTGGTVDHPRMTTLCQDHHMWTTPGFIYKLT